MNTPELQIIGAAYGLLEVTPIVAALVNRATTPQSLSVGANNQVFGDTWPGMPKSLTVVYRYGADGAAQVATATEGQTLKIGTATERDTQSAAPVRLQPETPELTIFGATYGPADKTALLRSKVDQGTQSLSVTASDQTFGDSWRGVRKTLVVVGAYTGQDPFVDIAAQDSAYLLKFRPPLRILSAVWGLSNVTGFAQNAVFARTLNLRADDTVLGDGWPNVTKTLAVVYQYGTGQPQLAIATEGQAVSIDYQPQAQAQPHAQAQPPAQAQPHAQPHTPAAAPAAPAAPAPLNVIKAAYGRSDVTAKVAALVSGNTLRLTAGNALFGDTWPNVRKSFSLTYSWGPPAWPACLAVAEGETVSLPLPPSGFETWMTDRWEQLKGRQIFDIAMPGTHNSGIFAWQNTIGVRNQDVDIAAQLSGGIRVFDIRVMTLNGGYVMHHSGITAPGQDLGTALSQFAAFASTHPSEKVAILLGAGYGSNLGPGDLASLRNYVYATIGAFMAPRPASGDCSLGALQGSIVVLSDIGDFTRPGGGPIVSWNRSTDYISSWQDWQSDCKPTIEWKINKLNEYLKPTIEGWSQEKRFRDASCLVWTINLRDAASTLNPKVSGWIGDWRSSARFVAGANIFSCDFFEIGGLVGTVIALNDRKQASPPPAASQPAEAAPQPATASDGVEYSMPRFAHQDSFSERRAEALIRISGLDWDELAGQYRRSGDISAAAREHLDRFGLPGPVVDEFLRWAKETGRG